MQSMFKMINAFAKDESGATAIEYGLIAALVAVGLIAALTALGALAVEDLHARVDHAEHRVELRRKHVPY